jgi:hypothetical protein
MFRTVAIVGEVHSCLRGVLWRWPFSVSGKCTSMLAMKSFRELYSHISYDDDDDDDERV